ncbi:MAG: hypothetical protein S0880_01735 [Actinomycetota bacterium]|nr:hypothetical protein [Actinomycetota bacterium]
MWLAVSTTSTGAYRRGRCLAAAASIVGLGVVSACGSADVSSTVESTTSTTADASTDTTAPLPVASAGEFACATALTDGGYVTFTWTAVDGLRFYDVYVDREYLGSIDADADGFDELAADGLDVPHNTIGTSLFEMVAAPNDGTFAPRVSCGTLTTTTADVEPWLFEPPTRPAQLLEARVDADVVAARTHDTTWLRYQGLGRVAGDDYAGGAAHRATDGSREYRVTSTEAAAALETEIAEAVAELDWGRHVYVTIVEHSFAELEDAHRRFNEALDAAGVHVTTTGSDGVTGGLLVDLLDADDLAADGVYGGPLAPADIDLDANTAAVLDVLDRFAETGYHIQLRYSGPLYGLADTGS